MPALLERRPQNAWHYRTERPILRADSATPQSADGRELTARIEEAQAQLAEPAEAWIEWTSVAADFGYEPMPPKRLFTMRVRMRRPERGHPMPFHLDDE